MIFKKPRPLPMRIETGVPLAPATPAGEPSYLGPDTAFEGNIVCDGEIHIDCELRGTVQAATCLVDTNGHVQGSISAQFVVVRGRVIGPINAQQLTISKGGHVEGNVVHQGISIEQGAFLMGSITQEVGQFEAAAIASASELDDADVLPALPSKI